MSDPTLEEVLANAEEQVLKNAMDACELALALGDPSAIGPAWRRVHRRGTKEGNEESLVMVACAFLFDWKELREKGMTFQAMRDAISLSQNNISMPLTKALQAACRFSVSSQTEYWHVHVNEAKSYGTNAVMKAYLPGWSMEDRWFEVERSERNDVPIVGFSRNHLMVFEVVHGRWGKIHTRLVVMAFHIDRDDPAILAEKYARAYGFRLFEEPLNMSVRFLPYARILSEAKLP